MGDMNISPHHCGEHYWLLRKFRDHFGYALDAAGGGQGDYDMHDQAGSFASWVGLRRVVQEPRARLSQWYLSSHRGKNPDGQRRTDRYDAIMLIGRERAHL